MNWNHLKSVSQLEEIRKTSLQHPVLIFKHSTRCSTSKMTLDRLERKWLAAGLTQVIPYFLDLLSFRDVSNRVADFFGVEHASPQVLLIWRGSAMLDLSHFEIDADRIGEALKN